MSTYVGLERIMLPTVGPERSRSNLRSGPTQAVRNLLLFGLLLILQATIAFSADATDEPTQALGFHAKPGGSKSGTKSCSNIDHPVFSELVTVLRREAEEFDFQVQLRSCPKNRFFAHTRPSRVYGRIFYVDMPIEHQFSMDTLSAVFAHELYHVFQYIRFGSFEEVLAHYGDEIKSAELAADFGAGYLLSKTKLPNVYEMNPELSGGFPRTHDDSHGTPAERSMAFRKGFYFTRRVSAAYSMKNAEAYFREYGQR